MKRSSMGRRSALAAPLAVAAVGALAFGSAAAAPTEAPTAAPVAAPAVASATTALPSVDMARVLAAAQVEPRCGDKAGLADNASTKLVQSALTSKSISTSVDGWYGNGTTSAYATWQRRQGYSGIDANGLPGVSSLTTLGTNRFTVAHKVSTGSRSSSYGGKRVNDRTRQMLQAADNLLPRWNFSLTQGSYNPGGVSASAGTHDGGGVVDISVGGLSDAQRWQQVKALRTVGFAAWLRTPAQGFSYHIHAVAIGDPDIWQKDGGHVARDQVCDYYIGKNGLASHAADNTPSSYRVPFTWWERYKGL
ncbi:peptidoglycan-binding protein [Knoellia sp. LjRoot47]|uniref:peptidoglycan-binding protein n=1 Tax=Knoellia sp. LjRoot47 TaxID=3342330 RepID=UPI003ED1614D